MLTDMRRMSCGNCGHSKFQVYAKEFLPEKGLWIQCLHCQSVTAVKPSEPRLKVGWPEDQPSDGVLCFLQYPED